MFAALLLASPALADPPRIEGVTSQAGANGWRFDVTIRHPDTGWDHYADGWRILDMDGTVLGTRVLHHPHETEQPFTRSLSGVAIPDGVIAWSTVLEGLVETSNNLGIVETTEEEMRLVALTRSSKDGAMETVQERAERALESSGATVTYSGAYPGWEAKTDTPLLRQAEQTYRRLFSKDPEVKAIHAGLECGLLGEKIPGLDMVSFGPRIEGAHSPDERAHIESVARFWEALKRVLDRLSS